MGTSWSCRSWPNVMYGVFPFLDGDECDEEDVDIILQGKKMEATKSEPKQQSSSNLPSFVVMILAQVLTPLQDKEDFQLFQSFETKEVRSIIEMLKLPL